MEHGQCRSARWSRLRLDDPVSAELDSVVSQSNRAGSKRFLMTDDSVSSSDERRVETVRHRHGARHGEDGSPHADRVAGHRAGRVDQTLVEECSVGRLEIRDHDPVPTASMVQ